MWRISIDLVYFFLSPDQYDNEPKSVALHRTNDVLTSFERNENKFHHAERKQNIYLSEGPFLLFEPIVLYAFELFAISELSSSAYIIRYWTR